MHMAGFAHDVWFRLFRDELSLRYEYESYAQCGNAEFRRIFSAIFEGKLGLPRLLTKRWRA